MFRTNDRVSVWLEVFSSEINGPLLASIMVFWKPYDTISEWSGNNTLLLNDSAQVPLKIYRSFSRGRKEIMLSSCINYFDNSKN